ncbi:MULTISPECIES: hypothetical protein [unclassified Frankia]
MLLRLPGGARRENPRAAVGAPARPDSPVAGDRHGESDGHRRAGYAACTIVAVAGGGALLRAGLVSADGLVVQLWGVLVALIVDGFLRSRR